MMFSFLQADVRKPRVRSIVEMIEKNFTFSSIEAHMDSIVAIAQEHELPIKTNAYKKSHRGHRTTSAEDGAS